MTVLDYKPEEQNTVLDYDLHLTHLNEKDRKKVWDANTSFSLAGFEMTLERHTCKYIVEYYLTSALFVIVSWVWKQEYVKRYNTDPT